jgi:hypothetical protein
MTFLPGRVAFARGDKPHRPIMSGARAARSQAWLDAAAPVSWKSAAPALAWRGWVGSSIGVWQTFVWGNDGVNRTLRARTAVRGERKNCNPQASREETVDGSQRCSVSVRCCRGKQTQILGMCRAEKWMIPRARLSLCKLPARLQQSALSRTRDFVATPPRAPPAAGEGPTPSSIRQDSAPEKSFPRSRAPGG